jgi:hypothetical protein
MDGGMSFIIPSAEPPLKCTLYAFTILFAFTSAIMTVVNRRSWQHFIILLLLQALYKSNVVLKSFIFAWWLMKLVIPYVD